MGRSRDVVARRRARPVEHREAVAVPQRETVLWAPFPGPQTEFCAAAEFEVLFGGAKGPGKTDCLLMAATRQVDRPRYKAYITRETGPQLDELKMRSHRLFSRMASKPAWNGDGHGRWTWPSGAVLIFESIGKPEDVEKIQGQEPSYVGQDEVGNIPDERTINLVQAEIRSPDPRIVRMWRGSANPGKPGHQWIKRRFVRKCGADGRRIYVRRVPLPGGREARLTRRYIPARVTDNPVYANDPMYMAQLMTLPEVLREQLLFGNWDAGYGAALDELDEDVHFCRPFRLPEYWVRFGAMDWGFSHPWVFGYFAVNEDGTVFVVDTVRGRRHLPHDIFGRIVNRFSNHEWGADVFHREYRYTVAGHDVNAKVRARGENTPSIAEQFGEMGLTLTLANIDRAQGLNNLRHYIAWKGLGPNGEHDEPAVRFFDTPGNRWLVEQLQGMTVDEDDMEDVLKVDADPVTGEGGDDGYDMLRYGMASRPPRAIGTFLEEQPQAFSKASLAYEVEWKYRDREAPSGGRSNGWANYTP